MELYILWWHMFFNNSFYIASHGAPIIIIIIIIIIINLFIVHNKNTIKNIFLSTNVALKTWLI